MAEWNPISLIFNALCFSARKHEHQRRKNEDATPYINHLITVGYILTNIGDIHDIATLAAAILHDTIEDTNTLPEELEQEFGAHIRAIVEEVTDDKSLPKHMRKQLQIEHAASASFEARCVKLADKIANLQDLADSPPVAWPLSRKREYVAWSEAVVNQLRGTNPKLEIHFDRVCQKVKKRLSE